MHTEPKRLKAEDVTPRNVGVAGGQAIDLTIVYSKTGHARIAAKLVIVKLFVGRQRLQNHDHQHPMEVCSRITVPKLLPEERCTHHGDPKSPPRGGTRYKTYTPNGCDFFTERIEIYS